MRGFAGDLCNLNELQLFLGRLFGWVMLSSSRDMIPNCTLCLISGYHSVVPTGLSCIYLCVWNLNAEFCEAVAQGKVGRGCGVRWGDEGISLGDTFIWDS